MSLLVFIINQFLAGSTLTNLFGGGRSISTGDSCWNYDLLLIIRGQTNSEVFTFLVWTMAALFTNWEFQGSFPAYTSFCKGGKMFQKALAPP